jgi:hypothetical protein
MFHPISSDAKAGEHGITREPPLNGHFRERILELGATVTAHLIGSTVDRKYPAQVVMVTAEKGIKCSCHAVHKTSFAGSLLMHSRVVQEFALHSPNCRPFANLVSL